jgi:hypothetical protein
LNLDRVSIGIKTFLRDGALMNTIQAIRDTMPEVEIVIADCGEHNEEKEGVFADLVRDGHKVSVMDFDAGFGAMSNRIADTFTRDRLLIGSDDFDFRPSSVREGIEKMAEVLDQIADVDIVGGRVFGPYEFNLEEKDGVVIEHRVNIPQNDDLWYVNCDLTVNYIMAKRGVFEKVRWDDDVKIGGGEHGAWFVDCKRTGLKVAYVPKAEIREQQGVSSPRYQQYRARSADPARPCFDRRGVRKYILGNGRVDYEAKA